MTSVSSVPTCPEVKIASMKPWRSYQGRKASGEQPGEVHSRRSYARIPQAFPLLALVCLNLSSCSIIILFSFRVQTLGTQQVFLQLLILTSPIQFFKYYPHLPQIAEELDGVSLLIISSPVSLSFHSSSRPDHKSYVYKLLNATQFGITGSNK